MDRQASTGRSDLERMLSDESEEPKALPLSLLEDITNSFSDDLKIGSGGFAVVYKGILGNGVVAVKRLSNSHMHEKEFLREAECLMKVKHKNVVRFLGYCADTKGNMQMYKGKLVMADIQERLLCFEYVPNGNLQDHIADASHGLEWRKRYEIIKGICEGLNYLHQNRIVHSDLKPANILLDANMIPKIADFGISRCFGENQSRVIITKLVGTVGYMAPEFFSGRITLKSDIYSLGVIITEIVTGEKVYTEDEDVTEIWKNRLEKPKEHSQLEQVRVCTKIGIECTDFNPSKRPVTQLIIDRLPETKSTDGSIKTAMSSSVVQSYDDGERILPLGSSLASRPPSVTSHEPEGMRKGARVGWTSRGDADIPRSNPVKLGSKACDDFVVTRDTSGNPTNMTEVLSNHIKSPRRFHCTSHTGARRGSRLLTVLSIILLFSFLLFIAYPMSESGEYSEQDTPDIPDIPDIKWAKPAGYKNPGCNSQGGGGFWPFLKKHMAWNKPASCQLTSTACSVEKPRQKLVPVCFGL